MALAALRDSAQPPGMQRSLMLMVTPAIWRECEMDTTRRRNLYKLMALVALAFGSLTAHLTGSGMTLQIVFVIWAVLFIAGVIVFRRKSDT